MKTVALILLTSAGICGARPVSEFPVEALREQYRTELREASRGVDEAHMTRLQKLKKRLMKRDRLKEAVAVEAEIVSIKVRAAHPDLFVELEGTWTFRTTGKSFHIGMDGAVYGGKKGVRVLIVDPARRIVRVADHLFSLADDGMELSGAGLEGGSRHPAKKQK